MISYEKMICTIEYFFGTMEKILKFLYNLIIKSYQGKITDSKLLNLDHDIICKIIEFYIEIQNEEKTTSIAHLEISYICKFMINSESTNKIINPSSELQDIFKFFSIFQYKDRIIASWFKFLEKEYHYQYKIERYCSEKSKKFDFIDTIYLKKIKYIDKICLYLYENKDYIHDYITNINNYSDTIITSKKFRKKTTNIWSYIENYIANDNKYYNNDFSLFVEKKIKSSNYKIMVFLFLFKNKNYIYDYIDDRKNYTYKKITDNKFHKKIKFICSYITHYILNNKKDYHNNFSKFLKIKKN